MATKTALDGSTNASASGVTTLSVCSCGQEIDVHRRLYCLRCGCCLS